MLTATSATRKKRGRALAYAALALVNENKIIIYNEIKNVFFFRN